MSTLPAHSKLGASSYERWGACPGSVNLSEGIEKVESSYAAEGTFGHDIAAHFLISGAWKIDEKCTPEMQSHLEVYINEVCRLRLIGPDFEFIEQKFDLSKYFPNLFGTGDYVCYFGDTKTLHVLDLKYGAGVPVEVKANKQLLYYAVGALHENKVPIEKVVLTIVQPRAFHKDGPVRHYECTPMEVLEYIADLVDDAKKTTEENAPLNAGEHCRWCPARGICPERKKIAIVEAQKAFAPTLKYDPVELSRTLSVLDHIESWASGVREFAYREAMAGRIPPGFKLVDKRASRKWRDNVHLDTLVKTFGKRQSDFLTSPEVISVAQAEKVVGKKAFSEAEEFLVIKESSGQNLVPEHDDRPAINVLNQMFEEIKTVSGNEKEEQKPNTLQGV